MNINIIIFSVLISVICVLLALVQYYLVGLKKITVVAKYDPYFRDLIYTPNINYVINYDSQLEKEASRKPRRTHLQGTEPEVEKCLEAAMAYRVSGKLEKALKLFEHAAVIAPHNPDVLNKYGEFLEKYKQDVILADELYFRALSFFPEHSGALANRKRTVHLVDALDLALFNHLDEKRDKLKRFIHTTLDYEAKKQAFYLHIYHTVGIEGNTMTVSELRYLLETGNAIGGKSIIEHNEILGLEIALRYVKTLSNTKFIQIDDVLQIHKRVMGYVDPLTSGVFRDQQVFVGSHVPPPVEDIHKLMDEYISWLNSDEALSMHPVRLAALAHYKLVDIHPFLDGNGRTSRLIMNLILLKFGYPPVIIHKDDRQKYYEYLNIANTGDVRPFVRFIAYCTDETLNTYLGLTNRLTAGSGTAGLASNVIQVDGLVV